MTDWLKCHVIAVMISQATKCQCMHQNNRCVFGTVELYLQNMCSDDCSNVTSVCRHHESLMDHKSPRLILKQRAESFCGSSYPSLPLTPIESSRWWSGWATVMRYKFLSLKRCDSDSANGTRGVTLFGPCYGVHTPRRLHGTKARIPQTAKNFRPTEGQFGQFWR